MVVLLSRSTALLVCVLLGALAVSAQSGWRMLPSVATGDLVAVYFTSAERGWVAGDDGYLASTDDGGRSWRPYPLGTDESINEIYFRNDDNGYLEIAFCAFAQPRFATHHNLFSSSER